jgi:hypothetical protein
MLILPLLIPKSPRLVITRMEMELKVLWRIASPLCRLPLLTLRTKGQVMTHKYRDRNSLQVK